VVNTLKERYRDDLKLLKFYQEKLLVPGWAGELDKCEITYVKRQLLESPKLKRCWGFRPSAKRLSEDHICMVARNGLLRKQKSSFSFSRKTRNPSLMV